MILRKNIDSTGSKILFEMIYKKWKKKMSIQ